MHKYLWVWATHPAARGLKALLQFKPWVRKWELFADFVLAFCVMAGRAGSLQWLVPHQEAVWVLELISIWALWSRPRQGSSTAQVPRAPAPQCCVSAGPGAVSAGTAGCVSHSGVIPTISRCCWLLLNPPLNSISAHLRSFCAAGNSVSPPESRRGAGRASLHLETAAKTAQTLPFLRWVLSSN